MSGKTRKLTPLTDPDNVDMRDPRKDGDIREDPAWRELMGLPPLRKRDSE